LICSKEGGGDNSLVSKKKKQKKFFLGDNKMKIKLSLFIVLLLVVGIFVTALAEKEIAKQIVIGRLEDSNDLDPITQDGNVNIWIFNLALEGLVKTSDDGTAIEPCLADSWDISEDGLTYTFHLKKGVKFSDGTPVTGEDWVWSFLRARDTKESIWKFSLTALKDVTAPDDNTVILTLKEPWAPFLADLAMFNALVQKKAYYEKVGQEAYSQKPIGTGPYVIKEWKKGEYLLLEKNLYYHIKGLPKTDEIKFVVVADSNTRILQLQAGQIDVATFVPFNKMKELENDPQTKVVGFPSTETRTVVFNHTKKPFDDLRVRLALEYATDKQALLNFILFGYGEVATTYTSKAGKYFNYGLKDRGYDIDKAKALLAEAGYPDGFETEFLLPSGNQVYEQLAILLKEQWSKIGVKVNIIALEVGLAVTGYRTMNYEISVHHWTDDIPDPSQQADRLFIPERTNCVWTGWRSDRAIELVKQGVREINPTKREQIYLELQQIYYDEVVEMSMFYVPYPIAMRKDIEGFVQTPFGNYRFENLVKYLK